MANTMNDADTTVVACCHLHRAMGCCDPTDCGPCCENCPTCPTLHKGQTPGKGYCVRCGTDVDVDGREGDEFGITWSHMRGGRVRQPPERPHDTCSDLHQCTTGDSRKPTVETAAIVCKPQEGLPTHRRCTHRGAA